VRKSRRNIQPETDSDVDALVYEGNARRQIRAREVLTGVSLKPSRSTTSAEQYMRHTTEVTWAKAPTSALARGWRLTLENLHPETSQRQENCSPTAITRIRAILEAFVARRVVVRSSPVD